MPPLTTPLTDSKFTLNLSGIASFFGGEEAIAAMATVHLYHGRRWLGWYNCPGTFTFAARFARMANSRVGDALRPPSSPPPILLGLGLDGKVGPKYIAALSGTTMHTGHLAYLTVERSKELKEVTVPGRLTNPIDVAYLDMGRVDYNTPLERLPLTHTLSGLAPITISIATCILCVLVYDWYSFSMIFLGMIASGLATFVIGRGKVVIRKSVRNSVTDPPPGILLAGDSVVVVKGDEGGVNAITRAHFELDFGEPGKGNRFRRGLRQSYPAMSIVCLFLFTSQFILQLLLIPQGTLFGQIMFVISLVVSWVHSYHLSTLSTQKIQADLLFRTLGNPPMHRFCVGTRPTMAVLVCLLLFNDVKDSCAQEGQDRRLGILHACLPHINATRGVWKRWIEKVVEQLMSADDVALSRLTIGGDEDALLSETEKALLSTLLGDARAAFEWYFDNWDMYYSSPTQKC